MRFRRDRAPAMADIGRIRFEPGSYQLDPNHDTNYVPMSLPGDRVWQGVQLDNGVTQLLPALNFLGRNPYQTTLEKSDRITLSNGGALVHNSQGPAEFNALMIAAGV